MEFHVFNVGHGFCALLVADNGNTMLFDCGHDDGGFRPSVYLPSQGIHSVDRFHISHFDSDHVSDLHNLRQKVVVNSIFRNPSMSSATLLSEKLKAGPLAKGLQSALDMHGSYTGPILVPPLFPGVECVTFHIPYPIVQDTNNLSLVTFVHCGKFHVVIPGDLEVAGWKELLKQPSFQQHLIRTNVFIASHHGRENGYCSDVFQYCSPELVIISDTVKQYESQEHNYHAHATGVNFPSGEIRKVLTTRCDGHISFYVDSAQATVQFSPTPPILRRIKTLAAVAGGRGF
jgi:beta-lactamase superfamily II metal-dependent hydrolase